VLIAVKEQLVSFLHMMNSGKKNSRSRGDRDS